MELLKKQFVSEIKEFDDGEKTLTAVISTNTRDRMDEVMDPRGVDLKNYTKNPVVLWAHDYTLPPIGKAQWVRRKGDSIISKVKFAGTPFAQEIFQLYKEGFLKAFSVGFVPKEYEDGDGKKTPMRLYKRWEMLEYSAVPVPANPDAVTMAIKKGIIHSDAVKKALGVEDDEEDLMVEVGEAETITKSDGDKTEAIINLQEDFDAEIKILEEDICYLKKENLELKYKIYALLQEKQKILSEIAVDNLAEKTAELMNGAIRKAQGKVD